MTTSKDLILWLFLCCIWGSSYIVIRIAVEDMSPLFLVCMRINIAAFIILCVIYIKKIPLIKIWKARWICLFSAVVGNIIPFFLIGFGELQLPSSIAALIMGIMPIVTSAMAPIILKDERYSGAIFVSIVFGIIGLFLIAYPDIRSDQMKTNIYFFAIVGAALCYASQNILVRKYANAEPIIISSGTILIGAVCSIFAALIFVRDFSISPKSLLAATYLGILPTATATLVFFYLLPRMGAQKMSLVNFLVPLVGLVLGISLLDEPLNIYIIGAVICIFLGLYFGLFRKKLKNN